MKYRPYKDTYEMIEDFKQRFNKNYNNDEFPCIWLKSKDKTKNEAFLIINYMPECVIYSCYSVNANYRIITSDMKDLFSECVYLDGSICGKEI